MFERGNSVAQTTLVKSPAHLDFIILAREYSVHKLIDIYLLCYFPDVIERVVNYVSTTNTKDWPQGLEILVSSLQKYQELLTDFTQAQVLQGLGRG